MSQAAPQTQAKQVQHLGPKSGMQTVSTGGGGGLSFARKQENTGVKALGAKKLDIDFGGDDFFNSF